MSANQEGMLPETKTDIAVGDDPLAPVEVPSAAAAAAVEKSEAEKNLDRVAAAAGNAVVGMGQEQSGRGPASARQAAMPVVEPIRAVMREAREGADDYKSMFTGQGLSDFLHFRTFAFPVFAKYLYIFFTLLVILQALVIFGVNAFGEEGTRLAAAGGLVYLAVGPVLVRAVFEIVYVLFKIHRELARLNQRK